MLDICANDKWRHFLQFSHSYSKTNQNQIHMWQIENEINTSFKKIFSKPRKKQKSIQKNYKTISKCIFCKWLKLLEQRRLKYIANRADYDKDCDDNDGGVNNIYNNI